MKKYKITHLISADFEATAIVNEDELTVELATKLPEDQSPLSSSSDPPPTIAAVLE